MGLRTDGRKNGGTDGQRNKDIDRSCKRDRDGDSERKRKREGGRVYILLNAWMYLKPHDS